MAITRYEFWYDKIIVRYLEQVVRAFSGFSYQAGSIAGQPPQTLLVPCRVATTSRMVANLMANLSENTLLSVPLISVHQTELRGRREDLQNPVFTDYLQVFERKIGPDGRYSTLRGNAYNVDRMMPVPFTMDVQVDIWTSNMQQKYMLIEQILPVMYPQFEIQNSDNALDWTSVTVCFVDDDFVFSSQTIPIGTSDEIDVMSIKLKIPFWLTVPAKVKQLNRIEEVVSTVNEGEPDPITGSLDSGTRYAQVIVSPDDACVAIDGASVTLLGAHDATTLPDGSIPSWPTLLAKYGLLRPTVSQLKLFTDDDIEGRYVTGTVQYSSVAHQLIWTIDPSTLPANTLGAINAVIDPLRTFPGQGLPSAASGQRYLLISDVGSSVAWGGLLANNNDIIEYVSGTWIVSFHSQSTTTADFVLNTFTGRQLRWTGASWAVSIDGFYRPGFWRILL